MEEIWEAHYSVGSLWLWDEEQDTWSIRDGDDDDDDDDDDDEILVVLSRNS